MTVYRDHQNRAFLGYLKSIVIYQQLGSLLPLCQILCHYVYYSYSQNAGLRQITPVFDKEVFNTHVLECTHTNIWIFFLKIMITLLGHWFKRR